MSAPASALPPMAPQCLSGGLPLLLLPRSGPQILAARLVIRGGSGADPSGQRGAHQLLAGSMTRGCGDLDADALADLVEGAGASLRAEAHEDALVIGLKCAADDAPALLPLLLALVRQPRLERDQVEIEQQLNLQTLQRQREDPYQLAHDRLRGLLYGTGPYGHDPLGVEEDLWGLGSDELGALAGQLGRWGAGLVVCGTIPSDVVELLQRPLAGSPWSTSAPAASFAEPSLGIPAGPSLATLEQDTEQLVLMLGAATVPLGHPDALALRLLQTHLGSGMSSRLFQVMREERGLAYDVGVSLPARCGPAPFVIHLSSSAERAIDAADALSQEWQRMLELSLSEEELALALAKYQGQDAMGRQTCGQIAERQALLLSHALPLDHVERCLRQAPTLSGDDLRRAARRWLQAPKLSLVGPAAALEAACRRWNPAEFSGGVSQQL
ncbi:MAG: M16 family metallopeptidase [Cyanobium sp.]